MIVVVTEIVFLTNQERFSLIFKQILLKLSEMHPERDSVNRLVPQEVYDIKLTRYPLLSLLLET